jgi:hypothetical protein
MANETLFAQIVHEAPSDSRREMALLPVFCMCELLRDDTGPSLDDERWITQRTYQKIHGGAPAEGGLIHTYCPKCFTQVMDRIKIAQVMETLTGA